MSQYYVYIHLEKYLAEWLLHQFGQNGQIRFPRGSAENDILEYSLTTQPADIPVPLKSPDSLAIEIPYFKTKDPRYYNFLPPERRRLLSGRFIFDSGLSFGMSCTPSTACLTIFLTSFGPLWRNTKSPTIRKAGKPFDRCIFE